MSQPFRAHDISNYNTIDKYHSSNQGGVTEIVPANIKALMELDLDLTGAKDVEGLKDRIRNALRERQ